MTVWIVFLILLALAFDFLNGFHDAANSIATIVSTRVMRPQWAVLWAEFFNFIAHLTTAQSTGLRLSSPANSNPPAEGIHPERD